MKYIKTLENYNTPYIIHPGSKYYQNKFFITPVHIPASSYEKQKKCGIVYCNEVLIPKSNLNKIWPNGDFFQVYQDNEVKLTGGYGWNYQETDFKNINFMTPIEFFNTHQELCCRLYLSVLKDSTKNWADWYEKSIKIVKTKLETIPNIKEISEAMIESLKYNL